MDGFGKTIAPRLRELRKSKGLKQKDLARLSGVNQNLVNSYEMGYKDHPDLWNLMQIANVLECSLDYLAGRVDTPDMYDNMEITA